MLDEALRTVFPVPRLTGRPVGSYTEWDPLEEVVVGRLDDAVFPTWQASMAQTMPESAWPEFRRRGGSPFPEKQLQAAQDELETFCEVLERMGVRVRRPDHAPHGQPFSTPHWSVTGGV